jgi:hypothetical protein
MTAESSTGWESMALLEQARSWHEFDPIVAKGIIKSAKEEVKYRRDLDRQDMVHRHRVEWALIALSVLGVIAGFGSVVILGFVAWHYADAGETAQGLGVFCSGAAAVATVFLGATGGTALVKRLRSEPKNRQEHELVERGA